MSSYRKVWRVGAILLLIGGAALTGCSPDGAELPDPAALTGKTFLSTSVTGAQIPGDGPLEVTFPEAGRIAATAGCNRHMGEVTFAGTTLTAGPLAATMMACPGAEGESDAWLSALFASPLTWSLSGTTLTLQRDDLTVELAERANTELVGPTWTVRSLVHDSGVESSVVIDRAAARLTFTPDGKVTGFTGCNDLGGTAKAADGKIRFENVVSTRKACGDEVMRVEQTVLDTLRGAATYRIDGDQLSLINDADPSVGLRLTAG